MLNRMVFSIGTLSFIFIMACSSDNVAGGTVDPNAIAENSSSSEWGSRAITSSSEASDANVSSSSRKAVVVSSSSSNLKDKVPSSSSKKADKVELSSSSVGRSDDSSFVPVVSSSSSSARNSSSSQPGDQNGLDPNPNPKSSESAHRDDPKSSSGYSNLTVHAENFSLQCTEDVAYNEGSAPDLAPPSPSAYFYVYNEAEVIRFENVYFDLPCNKEKRNEFLDGLYENGIDVGINGDTVFVSLPQTEGINCGCVAEGGFRLDKYYPDINYTVFNRQNAILLNEMHYTLVEDVEGHN